MVVLLAVLALLMASPAEATVIWSQTFESYSAGDSCTEILAGDSDITDCRQHDDQEAGTNNPSSVFIRTSIPGYSGSFPSGSNVMRVFTQSISEQADSGIAIGDSGSALYDNYIPNNVWIQFAWYINNTGAETTVTVNRVLKLIYPCDRPFPCQTGDPVSNNYWLLQCTRGSNSYAPFYDTALTSDTDGDCYLTFRDNAANVSSPYWPGTGSSGIENYLGQTSLSEWIKPGRWNIVRLHFDFSNASGARVDAWIGPMGSALTQVMAWHDDESVEGTTFTWDFTGSGGHRSIWIPSTQPANNTTGNTHYMYYDDIYVATSESDLPTYTAAAGSLAFFLRSLIPYVEILAGGLAVFHLIASLRVRVWARRSYAACHAALWTWRYRRAVKRWQSQRPLMITDTTDTVTLNFDENLDAWAQKVEARDQHGV